MYSTIKPKMGCCPECGDGKAKRLTNKLCQYHNTIKKAQLKKEKQLLRHPEEELEEIKRRMLQEAWFDARISEMAGRCQECGGNINKNIRKYAKCAVAHIFPKSTFPSVATNINNWMELCATNGCHSKAEDFEKAATMKIWPEMLRRIKILVPLIAPSERKRIPDIILQEIES